MTRSASTQALPTDAPAPYVEPTLTNKTKVTGNIKDGHNFMETKHISDISKLKAAAKPDDFRLSDFNLERIHRFVDEPQKNVGSNMAAITKVSRHAGQPVAPYYASPDPVMTTRSHTHPSFTHTPLVHTPPLVHPPPCPPPLTPPTVPGRLLPNNPQPRLPLLKRLRHLLHPR